MRVLPLGVLKNYTVLGYSDRSRRCVNVSGAIRRETCSHLSSRPKSFAKVNAANASDNGQLLSTVVAILYGVDMGSSLSSKHCVYIL